MSKRDVSIGDFSNVTTVELESEWRKAKECFDEALAQKIEIDRIYLAAANKLNALDRLVQKVEQRAASARRAANKSLFRQIS